MGKTRKATNVARLPSAKKCKTMATFVTRLPFLEKQDSATGKTMKVPGSFWEDQCADKDVDKQYVTIIGTFSALHKWPGVCKRVIFCC